MSSNALRNQCCGTLASKIELLEKENLELQNRIDDVISNQEINREAFAKRCFLEGSRVVSIFEATEKQWLNFKVTEL